MKRSGPLKRKTPLKAKSGLRRKAKVPKKRPRSRSKKGKRGPVRSAAYMEWIKRLPCGTCGQLPPVHAHHHRIPVDGGRGGMGTKPTDYTCIPLCADCHIERGHRHGWERLEQETGVDLHGLMQTTLEQWLQLYPSDEEAAAFHALVSDWRAQHG